MRLKVGQPASPLRRVLLNPPGHTRREPAITRRHRDRRLPEMAALSALISDFAALLTPIPATTQGLEPLGRPEARVEELPYLHASARRILLA